MHRPPHNVPLRGGGSGNPRPLYYPAPTQNPSAAFPYLLPPNAQYFWSPQYSASAPQPALPHRLPSTQNPAHYLQNPSGYGAPAVNSHGNGHGTQELLGRMEAALAKAHQDLLAAGESVSAWKVSQTALMALHVDSWASMGFQFQDIPYLRRLVATEGKVNAFIHCFVGVRKITTIHDLDASICKNEGIEHFAILGLGPLLRHPLVMHYFSVPPDTAEVPNILSEEVVCCLSSYVDKSEKMISVEEFLDFLVDKHAVDTKEKLGVRIQSLGMHIACIRKAKQAEHMVLSNSLKELRHTQDKKSRTEGKQLTRPPNMALEKEVLGRRFGSISKRIKSFSSECDIFEGKHTRFDTSDAEDSESDSKTCHESTSKNNSSIPQRVSSCPYPSTTEERQRLGLNSGIAQRIPKTTVKIKNLFGRKRKFKDRNKDCSSLFTLHEEDQVVHGDEIEKDHEIVLSSHKMEKFITMWKEACREHSVVEVLDMMLNFYSSTENKKKKIRKIFSSYPGVGLLNIAIACIKCGMLDSIYEIFQDIGEHGFNESRPGSTESIEIDLPVKYNENLTNKECTDKVENRVTVKDIIQKMTSYFLCVLPKPSGGHPFGNKFTILRAFHDCEMWLAREFSVDAFDLLGYGHFIGFSEKYWGLIPTEVRARLVGESCNSLLEVTIDQLQVLLSQAQENLMDNGNMSLSIILRLLEKQFPTLCLEFIGDEAEGHFRDLVRRQKENATSMNVFYSTTLLGKFFVEKSNEYNVRCSLEALGTTNEVDIKVSSLGPVSGKDALQCLCKAPMLTDLRSWSHWDLVYAPTLGPLLIWLQNQIHKEKLSCIVTSDGRIVRIDHTATVEEFLEASIQCSPFHCALKLLSLLALYGGINNIPLALLKCYAQRAVDVIVKNSMDYEELNDQTDCFLYGSSFKGQVVPGNDVVANKFSADNWSTLQASRNKGINVAAMFILNCLEHLPSEFRIFAAEIWMSALQSSTKDSSLVMLRQCKEVDQRIFLHDIGLALGIVEWIEDYRLFISATTAVQDPSRTVKSMFPAFKMNLRGGFEESSCSNCKIITGLNSEITKSDVHNGILDESQKGSVPSECSNERCDEGHGLVNFEDVLTKDATLIVESIRREEFGLDPNFKYAESNLLKKQHARLGRALHCLSQELYSQDSHLLLELVQNADDNTYPDTVEPTLIFILQPTGIIVLNNELGFSAENIRALSDIGNSTKKGSSAGYIGHKGIGFKSVFRVTDAPEIHSNGFHVKFDISEGQIGFVLPTVIPPCDVSLFERQITSEVDQSDVSCWKTCIVLPFRSKHEERSGMSSIISMFSDLHPSLLLFLHRLQCIKLRNMLNDSLMVMKKETLGDGIIKVSFGTDKINWLVVRQNLHASIIRPDVQTTEIAVAFTLLESDSGEYKPYLNQQPVFAFLPLRTYGLKFILQGDFVLPSSREEVDGDSAWNQWLLSEFPDLFVSSKRDFIGLPCFKNYPGKAVSAFMSFVPLAGEVHGFFSHLAHMIVSKLRTSNCLLLEGHDMEWVSPCRVIRGWDEQVRTLLSDELLQRHLGLGYLNRDIVLSDSLAKALGIREYGPKILSEIISSICHDDNGIQQLGFDWLCNWFITLNNIISSLSSGHHTQNSENTGPEVSDVISSLREIPFIPLSNGSYGSIAEGPIWLSFESFSMGSEGKHGVKDFPRLYAKLRIVNPLLISAASPSNMEESGVENLLRILHKIGVQSLSAHEVIKMHIIPALCARSTNKDKNLMVEYLSYVMFHFQYPCTSCQVERVGIITQLQSNSILLTNHGYKSPIEEPVHFGRVFGNPIDKSKLIGPDDSNWNEVDDIYLKHYSTQSVSSRVLKWREFFQELGVTDFVQVIRVEKSVGNFVGIVSRNAPCQMDNSAGGSLVSDWESPELIHLLSALSSGKQRDKCMYLLEILDKMWDDYYSSGERNYARGESIDSKHPLQSSFLKCLHDFKWIASSADEELHYPKDLFYDCEAVRSLLGSFTPFAVPQVKSKLFLNDIGFKIQVTFDDALAIFRSCGMLQGPVSASIVQMSNFYSFIWEQTNALKVKIMDELKSCPRIFVPSSYSSGYSDIVSGTFLSSNQVYWHDPTGCLDQLKKAALCSASASTAPAAGLSNVYPNLHDFFVNECGVQETPPFGSYVLILLQLSNVTLPSETAHLVFQVFLKWSDDLNAGRVQTEEMVLLTESLRKLENTVLPTVQDKWVSLHPTFGLVCWSDDEELRNQFKHSHNVSFIHFGELSDDNKEILSRRVSKLLQRIGVPSISEVVSREAIFYGTEDCRAKICLINWALPYAQRYLFKLHPDKYLTLKKSVIEKLDVLQIAVVEKLFYRYTIKGCTDTSRKRFECSCLLQGNVLYMTRSSDSHSIFLELSRVFLDGSSELHFANFLHMVATMAESGSTEDQIEFFIVNSQLVPKLPIEETVWSLTFHGATASQNVCPLPMNSGQSILSHARKTGIIPNWPPTDWKTAPDFSRARHYGMMPVGAPYDSLTKESSKPPEGVVLREDIPCSVEVSGDWIVEDDNSATTMDRTSDDLATPKVQSHSVGLRGPINGQVESSLENAGTSNPVSVICLSVKSNELQPYAERDTFGFQAPSDERSRKTGSLGEAIAYKYFSEKYGTVSVKWVNEESETGLPYDLIIGDDEGKREYVEVKATRSTTKDWFHITMREWQFAAEKGEFYSIAHIVLAGPKNAKITVFKNPLRLCQQNLLHLAVVMSRR